MGESMLVERGAGVSARDGAPDREAQGEMKRKQEEA
jgi:hypothetical protein